jgi:hypothetical protein
MITENTAGQTASTPTKKPYAIPVLQVFGSVAAVTQTSNQAHVADDGGPGTNNSVS